MKSFVTLLFCLLSIFIHGQDTVLKEMSYTDFFDAIETSKDSVFSLSEALIVFNESTDERFKKLDSLNSKRDTIVINKPIKLDYVHFDRKGSLNYLSFNEEVEIINSMALCVEASTFKGDLTFWVNYDENKNPPPTIPKNLDKRFTKYAPYYNFSTTFLFKNNKVVSHVFFENYYKVNDNSQGSIMVLSNVFDYRNLERKFFSTPLICSNLSTFQSNDIYNNYHQIQFSTFPGNFKNNSFHGFGYTMFPFNMKVNDYTTIEGNKFNYFTSIDFTENGFYSWEDLKDKFLYAETDFQIKFFKLDSMDVKKYANKRILEDNIFFTSYVQNLEKLEKNYRSKRDFKSANAVYVAIKDLETDRLKHDYKANRNFDTFFQWQINRFIGMFSDYGTKPSKAIVISMYVILIFALFYFLFPNDWDSNGKNRIMNRYNFFMKYLNVDSGMHEIYQDETRKKMLEYEEFKNYIETSKHTTPKFFKATALPLYRWSILGSKFTSSILKRFDILKGTWKDVPKKHKWWKGLIIIFVFIIAILYDIIIKFLNALMLSINTFSTLGFGEIPIKGLPRYLAIIQGFIGWFMLTIFSVSLISQLLS
ncbi:ion channel [Psychroserpens sp. XS_ASV72]|uniref:ion channel n=1 Tax=Psychroserpens sp. XS_ASV72 TaxID=3241293 RepID=UPI0035112D9D